MQPDGAVLLYASTCGFCAESVQVVLRQNCRGKLRFVALQAEFGACTHRQRPDTASRARPFRSNL